MSDLRDNIIDIITNTRTLLIPGHMELPMSDEEVADIILSEFNKEMVKILEAFGVD